MLESRLLDCLSEYLNAEIVLRTIADVSMAIKWLTTTFLYVRVNILDPIFHARPSQRRNSFR